VAIAVTPNQIGAVALTASVTSSAPDPSLVNNTAAQITTVHAGLVSPEPPALAACTPRPNLRTTVVPGAPGTLNVTLTGGANPSLLPVGLHEIRFGTFTNGVVDFAGGPTGLTGNVTVPVAADAVQATFVVRRVAAGAAVTVPFTVADECGDFPTFVGGGPNAFP
jgi:hypothetical protein